VVIFAVHPVATDATHKTSSVTTTVAVIPVRYDSTRLPGKPLADIAGQTMIERVYRRAERAKSVDNVIVATDDSRIADAVTKFGGEIYLTRSDHSTGSDRLAEVAESLTCDIIVNVQGDEPLLDPLLIDSVHSRLQTEPTANTARMKFLPGIAVLSSGTMNFQDVESSARSPLAQRLFAIEGVIGVYLDPVSITLTRSVRFSTWACAP